MTSPPNPPDHTRLCREETYTDRRGRKRVRCVIQFERSDTLRQRLNAARLGPLAHVSILPPFPSKIRDAPHHLFVGGETLALRAIATRVADNRSPHLLLRGADLVRDYLDDAVSPRLLSGYPDADQLFVLFGYADAKNQALPGLIAQLQTRRQATGRHLWVFLPEAVESLIRKLLDRWGADIWALQSLQSLPIVPLDALLVSPRNGH